MADMESRKLRKGKEKALILALLKKSCTKSRLSDLFFDRKDKTIKLKHPLVKRMRISYKYSFKIKVVYQPEASEVNRETYYASLADIESNPAPWKAQK